MASRGQSEVSFHGRPRLLAIVSVAFILLLSLAAGAPVAGQDGLPVSLEYTLVPGAYNNAVRVANVTDMLYPRIVVDRGAASPYRGAVYVIGLDGADGLTCRPIVVARSSDGGLSFDAPRRTSPLCAFGPS